MKTINEAAARAGRTLRFSLSLRPIIADSEDEAWERAEWIAQETAARIELAKARMAGQKDAYEGLGGQRNATFSVDRDTSGTTSVGRKRLIEMSADKDVLRETLDEGGKFDGRRWKLDRTRRNAGAGRRSDAALLRPRHYDAAVEGL